MLELELMDGVEAQTRRSSIYFHILSIIFHFLSPPSTISLGYHVSPALSSVLFSSHENIFTTVSSVTTLSLDSKWLPSSLILYFDGNRHILCHSEMDSEKPILLISSSECRVIYSILSVCPTPSSHLLPTSSISCEIAPVLGGIKLITASRHFITFSSLSVAPSVPSSIICLCLYYSLSAPLSLTRHASSNSFH